MNLRCTVLRSSICFFCAAGFFFLHGNSFAQVARLDTIAFYKHLKEQDLLLEQIVFAERMINELPSEQTRNDSLSLDIAASYLYMKMPDSAAVHLKKISGITLFPENKRELYISSLILCRELALAEKNLGSAGSRTFAADVRSSFSMLRREKPRADTSATGISLPIFVLRNQYLHTPQHSAFLAGAFSAVLPGAGKWYVGYKRQAVTAFISNLMFAAQAYESYSKAGIKSPQFIITAGLFSIFYSGNIWGSVLAAKKKKRDHLNEIDYEILDHYRAEFSKLSR